MNMVVSGLQGTFGVPKNNNALDHGNTIRLTIFAVISVNASVRNTRGVELNLSKFPIDTQSPDLFPDFLFSKISARLLR